MISFRKLTLADVHKLTDIDRSETIDILYRMHNGVLNETPAAHECPTWDEELTREMQGRFIHELQNDGVAVGAFDGELLVGFGVLAHQFRGREHDQLQIDLMFVSRRYRRQGIGTRIMNDLSVEARARGAKYLYISSTETRSAVSFYKSCGSQLADELDEELFEKEPNDIHMIKKL
ncbi:GNAT family N-acetyltransferase [Paenibacillus sacheonensis]|uniref:GNAT family N-acetyltransferase n=1 Tax=Paenibacillus sacheonensis TaxID=742054 RepID=A0A7X5C2X3_9BACL|nr:GNAT family N-acetyltransferase [Paenibacillus sacheonensis]MBM7569260.1 GNAT superfamily N-acetyltransferase [Paenibacillus sacheonensis]NBC71730.1 GNAT family N-acetyltransferase [Paenibacillus sacheonensis]